MLQDITSLKLMQRPTESTKRTSKVPRKVANSLFTYRDSLKITVERTWFLTWINAILSGMVGITLNTDWQVPKNPNDSKDKAASDRAINFMFGWFLNPVIRGDYPDVMKEQVDRKSKEQGFTTSRLPSFTPNEKLNIKGRFSNSMIFIQNTC